MRFAALRIAQNCARLKISTRNRSYESVTRPESHSPLWQLPQSAHGLSAMRYPILPHHADNGRAGVVVCSASRGGRTVRSLQIGAKAGGQ